MSGQLPAVAQVRVEKKRVSGLGFRVEGLGFRF